MRLRNRLPDLVYRVQISRPERNDSKIIFTTSTPESIKEKYGNLVILITPYRKDNG